MSQKTSTRLAGYEIKSMKPIFKNEMFIVQSKANLDKKILLGKITHHLDPETASLGIRCPHSILVHNLLYLKLKSISDTDHANSIDS